MTQTYLETATAFFDACETGKGWATCQQWCAEAATFSCQSDALADTKTLADYCEWMKGLLTPIPDGHYVLTSFAMDEARETAVATAEFRGTQTGEGGPIPATGNSVVSDYAYVMKFEDGKIAHMTKIWNDAYALRALGWA